MWETSTYCPCCKELIPWKWGMAMSNYILGTRKSVQCPHCGKFITWAKWPHRIMYIVAYLLIVLGSLHCLLVLLEVKGDFRDILFFVILLLGPIGIILPFTIKLAKSDFDE